MRNFNFHVSQIFVGKLYVFATYTCFGNIGDFELKFFAAVAALITVVAGVLIWPVIGTYLETGLVPRLPTAVLSMGLMILAALTFTAGLILDTVTRGRREAKRMRYLSIEAPQGRYESR